MSGREIGRLVGLWRYPVKSMAEESLDAVDVSWHGLAGDRRWAFVQDGMPRNGFPWQTIRELPAMRHYLPSFVEPGRPDDSRTMVRTPGRRRARGDRPGPRRRAGRRRPRDQAGRRRVRHDAALADHDADDREPRRLGRADADPERFRPNLLVEATGDEAFPEDEWVGSVLRIGDLRMRVDQRDVRCVMINIDPDTDEKDPDVLRTVARERDTTLGVYGATVTPGRVMVGDPVVLEA